MSTGKFISSEPDVTHSNAVLGGCNCWHLGSVLEAASFQNFVMWEWFLDDINEGDYWHDVEVARFAYEVLHNDSKLRKFVADMLAFKNPFEECSEGDEDHGMWCQLFKDSPGLGLDVAKAVGTKNSRSPGHITNIRKYMEKESVLNKA